jgi:hypothetical protein
LKLRHQPPTPDAARSFLKEIAMLKIRTVRPLLAALVASTALCSAWAGDLPPVKTQGAVTYLSGGIGKDEAKAVEAAAPKWPAVLEFVVKDKRSTDDAFLANVSVQILDPSHRTVLATVSDGPFVLARLQPGRYEVKATADGKTLTRALHVAATGSTREVFVWPGRSAHAAG